MTGKRDKRKRSASKPWWMYGTAGIVVVALVVVLLIAALGHSDHATSTTTADVGAPVPSAVLRNLTTIPSKVWEQQQPTANMAPQVVATKASATFLYIGADGCPYCAAERWAIIVALSRFGTFSHLHLMLSASNDAYPDTPTFSFYGASYHSAYVKASLMEILGRTLGPQGFSPNLAKLSASQEAILTKYDAPPYVPSGSAGSIPFVLVGGRFLWVGTAVPPAEIHGNWDTVSAAVHRGTGSPASAVLSSANALTAAICASDGDKPTTVCSVPVIRRTLKSWKVE